MTRAARAAARTARQAGIKAGVLQLVTIWPFPDREVFAAARQAKTVVVAEMNYSGQVASEVQRVLGPAADLRQVNKYNGQAITPGEILQVFK